MKYDEEIYLIQFLSKIFDFFAVIKMLKKYAPQYELNRAVNMAT